MQKVKELSFQILKEVVTAFQFDQVALHAQIKVRLEQDKIVETTVGRVTFI